MIEMESNHCRIVNESLSGHREVDGQTFDALSVLSGRLEHLKQFGAEFGAVEFSPEAQELIKQGNAVPVA